MNKEPKKVFIHKNGTYVGLSHEKFCELKNLIQNIKTKNLLCCTECC